MFNNRLLPTVLMFFIQEFKIAQHYNNHEIYKLIFKKNNCINSPKTEVVNL